MYHFSKKIFIFLAFLLLIAFIYILPTKIQEYNVAKSGNYVTVTVLKLPKCSSGRRNHFIDIEYKGETYSLRTKCKFVRGLSTGQQIKMLHKPDTSIFLFKQADVETELISNILLIAGMVISLIFILKPYHKK